MASTFKKFDLYYLGTNTSSTPPSFSNAVLIRQIILEIKEQGSAWPGTFTGNIGSWNSSGTVNFNSTGVTMNNLIPFNTRQLISLKFTNISGYNRLNTSIDSMSDAIVNLNELYTFPTNTSTRIWFAYANVDTYIPFCYTYTTNYFMFDAGIGTGYTATIDYIRYKSNGAIVSSTRKASFCIPLLGAWVSNSSGFAYWYYSLQKSGNNYYCLLPNAYYPLGSANTTFGLTVSTNTNILNSAEKDFINNATKFYPPPYDDGGTSTESEGGTGTFDNTSDTISAPQLPSTNVSNAGFVRIYNPTLAELQNLANYMWTDTTFLQTVVNHAKQLLENPIESVIALNILPCPIPEGAPESVKVLFINTGVTMSPATTQFVDVDCGSYTLKEYYGSALDYSPYTRVHCYLPYIGQVTLDTDEVMGKTISIKYRIDIVTGMCVALISVGASILYQFSGHCAISMPLTSADFSTYFAAALQAAKIATGVVAGAAGAPDIAASLIGAAPARSSTSTTKTTERNPQTGRQITSGTSATYRESSGASFGEMAVKGVSNTVNMVMNSKPIVEHTGGFTGNSGYLAVRRPYLIIEIPRMCNPEDYGKYNGYPSMLTLTLNECEGFTKVQEIHLTGFSATNPEMSEIAELLKGGVVF